VIVELVAAARLLMSTSVLWVADADNSFDSDVSRKEIEQLWIYFEHLRNFFVDLLYGEILE
jgi:hypothetical protein